MRTALFSLIAFCLGSSLVLAQPRFSGYRDDDLPVPQEMMATVSAKNERERIPDMESVQLADNTMLVRVYAGFGDVMFEDGRHPLDLYEIRFRGDSLTVLIRYPACESGMQLAEGSVDVVKRALHDYRFLDIRDTRSDPAGGGTMDGTTYLIQIKTADQRRELLVSNPDFYESDDSKRFRAVLRAIASEFKAPDCSSAR